MTRSVGDAAAMLGIISGYDPLDKTTTRDQVPDFSRTLGQDICGLRIGVVDEMMSDELSSPETRDVVERAIEVMAARGAVVKRVRLPSMTESRYVSSALVTSEAVEYHRQNLLERYSDFDRNTRRALMVGALLPARLRSLAARARDVICAEVVDALRGVDVLVGPTTPGGAAPISEFEDVLSLDGAKNAFFSRDGIGQLTRVFSLAGVPAVSVPCGFDRDGLPLGLQIVSSHMREDLVLRLGFDYERQTTWHKRRAIA